MEHNLFNILQPYQPPTRNASPLPGTPRLTRFGLLFYGYLGLLRWALAPAPPPHSNPRNQGAYNRSSRQCAANIANFCWFNKIAPTRLIYMECWQSGEGSELVSVSGTKLPAFLLTSLLATPSHSGTKRRKLTQYLAGSCFTINELLR